MKRIFSFISLLFCLFYYCSVWGDTNDDWKEKPIITHLYELSKDKFTLEWEGNADLYQVFLDGKIVSTANIKYAEINLSPGAHQIGRAHV